jgi:hypothetical protein
LKPTQPKEILQKLITHSFTVSRCTSAANGRASAAGNSYVFKASPNLLN